MYSEDLRDRVLAYLRSSARPSIAQVAEIFQVSVSTIRRWNSGVVPTGKRKKKIDLVREHVRAIYEEEPFATYQRVQALLLERTSIKLSVGSIFTLRKELGITRKRVVARKICSSQAHVDRQRETFRATTSESDFRDAISLDECHFKMYATPLYGYAPKGQRVLREVSEVRHESYSLLLAIDRSGVVQYEFYHGAVNSERFSQFIKTLPLAGRRLLMDNVAFHRSRRVQEQLARQSSSALFTPPYTPEYNPVELAFAQIRAKLRAKASQPHASGRITTADIDEAISSIEGKHCTHYFDFVWDEISGRRTKYPEIRKLVRPYRLGE